jgi:CheY-like chemotaxis protein
MSDLTRPISVLLVDDDREIREVLGELLLEEGFTVEASWNGETALRRLQEGFRPDVIVLDIMMPIMNGSTFRALQRQNPAMSEIPVVGLTAFPPADADFECLRKPVRFETLVLKIRSLARCD